MTTTEKIAISLPKDLASRARKAVRRGDAPSMSAYVSRALEQQSKLDDLNALLDEMLAETGGPLTKAELRAADRDLGVGTAQRRRPSK
jgi:Arc/MetJ-type ribon-helix-helix transcriptional regulator